MVCKRNPQQVQCMNNKTTINIKHIELTSYDKLTYFYNTARSLISIDPNDIILSV